MTILTASTDQVHFSVSSSETENSQMLIEKAEAFVRDEVSGNDASHVRMTALLFHFFFRLIYYSVIMTLMESHLPDYLAGHLSHYTQPNPIIITHFTLSFS